MTTEEAIAILENEKECVNRANKNDYCNRDCYNCELVKTDTEILTALEMAISALSENKGEWIEVVTERFTNGEKRVWYYECSACGMGEPSCPINKEHWDYCPNCGAKMERGET